MLIPDRDAFLGEKSTLGIFLSPLPLVKNHLDINASLLCLNQGPGNIPLRQEIHSNQYLGFCPVDFLNNCLLAASLGGEKDLNIALDTLPGPESSSTE